MQNKCSTLQVAYEVDVINSTDEQLKIHYGLTEKKHRNHKISEIA